MAQNKSYKELMELQGAGAGKATSNQMLELILNRQPFQYNAQTDPAAQAARKAAARNARAVTQDTMGQYAGMTGGVPSTAAVSAAAQAGNQAMQQGVDKVDELEQLAFQNYQTEGQNMYNAYAAMQGAEEVAQARADAEYQKKLALAQLAAAYGDYSGLKALGVDTSKYTAGGGYQYSNQNPNPLEKLGDKPEGLPTAMKNDLKYQYGYNLPEDVYEQVKARYGEDALIAAGFKKKAQQSNPTPGSGSNSSGSGKKPGLPGMRHPGVAKGESELGTRD